MCQNELTDHGYKQLLGHLIEVINQALNSHVCSLQKAYNSRLNAILVEEPTLPTDRSPPIRWLLLTTLAIETFGQALQCVQWYTLRWLIERFHYTLKSGWRFERLQLQTQARLLNALATYAIVAWRLMSLTYPAINPDAPCDGVLQPNEWRLLRRKVEPKNRSRKTPTLHQVIVGLLD